MVRIRLKRVGAKKHPFYRIVVVDQRAARDGAFIEQIGTYDPFPDPPEIKIDEEKVAKWMKNGAQPSDSVVSLFQTQGILPKVTTVAAAPEAAKKAAPKAAAKAAPKAAATATAVADPPEEVAEETPAEEVAEATDEVAAETPAAETPAAETPAAETPAEDAAEDAAEAANEDTEKETSSD
jgi:small subunit ribosomal protein S16